MSSDTEPSLLRDPVAGPDGAAPEPASARAGAAATATEPMLSRRPATKPPVDRGIAAPLDPPRFAARQATTVHVVGFWTRTAAAVVDLAIVIPAALLVTLVASKLAGVSLSNKVGLLDIDMWIDLVLATDPALVMGGTLFAAIGLVYLLVFHIVLGRTLGMRLCRIRVIDVYGEQPSPARCVARCAGYLAGVATLFLGFLWMGFDSEKRGLQDWIAGTYVIRA